MPARDRTDTAESPSDRFERLAAAFYYETGIMAPGKDDALGTHDYDARVKAWREWMEQRFVTRALDASKGEG